MLKHYTAILSLCIASLVMTMHGLVPHHHHDHDIHEGRGLQHEGELGSHQDGDHHDNDHRHGDQLGECSDLVHQFSHHTHPPLVFVADEDSSDQHIQQVASVALLPEMPRIVAPESKSIPLQPPKHSPRYHSPHARAAGLRAPPIAMV